MSSGRLIAHGADGAERRLRRRDAVYAGDTIKVGKNAFVQIRFTDGGIVSLRPDSELKVSEYHHQEQPTENGNLVFELLKGGLRTISGSIGKKNNRNYQLKTPVATIGIRGTHHGLRLCNGDCNSPQGTSVANGLYGGILDGAIQVQNQRGEWDLAKQQYYYVKNSNTPLKILPGPPGIVFDSAANGSMASQKKPNQHESLPGQPIQPDFIPLEIEPMVITPLEESPQERPLPVDQYRDALDQY